MSMVMDDESPDVLAADSDSGSVWDFNANFIINEL